MSSQAVTNEAGDSIEISAARPGPLEIRQLEDGGYNYGDCSFVVPYLGSGYDACGYVNFYDAKWEAAKAPITNFEEDAQYDACGTLVSSGKTIRWHIVGTEYIRSGWINGHPAEVPTTESPSCLGLWTEVYSFTETFSDGQTLTDSIEAPFQVTLLPMSASARWGGGNPTELNCYQQCAGDPVNTATGEYSESTTDLAIPGRGPGLEMTRTYSSLAAKAGASSLLGRGWEFSYDMRLSINSETGAATITNANGSHTEFASQSGTYVAPPRVLATLVKNEDGSYTYTIKARTIYTFNSAGKLTSIADLNGNKTTLAYDESGRLKTATDGAGRTLTFSYDEAGRLKSVSDSTGRSVSYAYSPSGYLEEVTDVRGGHEHFTYDESALLLTRKDARENVVLTNTYNGSGRVLSQTDALERKTTFSYSEAEGTAITEVINPRKYATRYEYANGLLAKRIDAKGTAKEATWTYEYDPITLGTAAITDPNGHTRRFTYDARGNRTSTEDALGHKAKSVYDSLDDLTEYTDANGVTTTFEYDKRGNLLKSSTPLVGSEPATSRVVKYAYEDEAHPGDVTAITDPNGKTPEFKYDNAGDLTSATNAAGDRTTFTYNERGDRLTRVSPRGNVEGVEPSKYTTTFTYNAAGNRLTAVDPLGGERKWTYDADGNVETETDANGHTTTYTYDVANQLTKVKRPNGDTSETAYDANGNVSSQTDGLKHATTYTYDQLDHLESSSDPLGRKTSYVFDGAGLLKSKTDPNSRTTSYKYDAADRLSEITYSDGVTPKATFGYDADGHRTSMSDGTGSSSFVFDSLGRLKETTDGHGDKTAYGYDLAGNQTSIAYPNGKSVTQSFDSAERLENVTDWLGNTTSFSYDRDSGQTATTFPATTGNVDEYAYDRADRMGEVKMKFGSEALASLAYARDKAGQIESLTSKGLPGAESEGFKYDENNRLTSAGTATFGYDAADNLTKAAGTTNAYDVANELEASGTTTYGYDGLGERTSAGPAIATYSSAFGTKGEEAGQFRDPCGIAIDSKGNLWVVDYSNNRLEKFSEAGAYLSSFGSFGTSNGQFNGPLDVAIDAEGHLWVADSANARIEEFDATGKYLGKFGKFGNGEGEFGYPFGLAIDSKGNIWVVDGGGGHRVQEFSSKGKFIRALSSRGTGEGQIWSPTGVAIGPGNTVWVADPGNSRIEEFNETGGFIRQFGSYGSGNGQFKGATGIEVDSEGSVWVPEAENNRVQKFSSTGSFLGKFGTSGSGEGQFSLGQPIGIATNSAGKIWISDAGNNRVQQWQMAKGGTSTTYKYDQAGNLTAVERPASGEVPAISETYAYDGTGLRSSQTVSGTKSYLTWSQGTGLPLLLNDGQTNYIYGPGGLPVEQISSTGAVTYYHHDQLGSTRMLTNSSGTTTGTFTYGAYGSLIGKTGTQTTPLAYAGQYTNAQSGLQYLRARAYDPATGQFLTRDPIEVLTRQPYAYVRNNPLNYTDPMGMFSFGDVLHVALNVAAVPPYAVYYGAHELGHAINSAGSHLGTPGEVASHILAAPLVPLQAQGLAGDAAIDWIKGNTVAEESICDEGPGSVVYLNPLHDWLPPDWKIHNAPGINEEGTPEIEW